MTRLTAYEFLDTCVESTVATLRALKIVARPTLFRSLAFPAVVLPILTPLPDVVWLPVIAAIIYLPFSFVVSTLLILIRRTNSKISRYFSSLRGRH